MEMVRMATIYQAEGNIENAYILYIKFMTLFLEKILEHPEYKSHPAAAKRLNQERLKEVLPIAEKLRVRLLQRYDTEYRQHILEQQQLLAAVAAQRRRDIAERTAAQAEAAADQQQQQQQRHHGGGGTVYDVVPSAPPGESLLDQVVYPKDFPPAVNRQHEGGAGLLLPDPTNVMPK